MTMTPDPMRATAERLAREVVDRAAENYPDTYDRWREMSSPNQDRFIACVLAGLTHRDRTAEREAARKAWYAGYRAAVDYARNERRWLTHAQLIEMLSSCPASSYCDRDRYLAAEFGAGERVTLSDGSVVTRRISGGAWSWVREKMPNARFKDVQFWQDLLDDTDSIGDQKKVAAFAALRGTEEAPDDPH